MVKTTYIALALTITTVFSSFLASPVIAAEHEELAAITAERDVLRTRLSNAIAYSKARGVKLEAAEMQLAKLTEERKTLADRLRRVIAMSKERKEKLENSNASRKQTEDRLRRVIAMSKERKEKLESSTASRKQAEDRLRRVISMSKERKEKLASSDASRKQTENRLRRAIAISKERGNKLASSDASRKQTETRLRRAIAHSKSTRIGLEDQLQQAESQLRAPGDWVAQVGASLEASIGGIDGTSIVENYTDNTVKVQLGNTGLFSRAGVSLSDSGKALLSQIAPQLQFQNASFNVIGHTDNIPVGDGGRYESNEELSLARSMSALRFLRDQGIPKEHLSAAGHGADSPIASNDTPEGRQQNRRVEIVLRSN